MPGWGINTWGTSSWGSIGSSEPDLPIFGHVSVNPVNDFYNDLGYTAEGISAFIDYPLGVRRYAFSGEVFDQFLSMTNLQLGGCFLMEDSVPPLPFITPPYFTQLCTVKNLSTSLDAWVALYVKDVVAGERSIGRWWKLPPDDNIYDVTYQWTLNPFTGGLWQVPEIVGGRYRFGLLRDINRASVKWQRLKIIYPV